MQMPYAGGFEQSVQQTVALEKAGLDIVYVAEAYSFDAVSAMGFLAARTETVQIAAGILPIYQKPTVLSVGAIRKIVQQAADRQRLERSQARDRLTEEFAVVATRVLAVVGRQRDGLYHLGDRRSRGRGGGNEQAGGREDGGEEAADHAGENVPAQSPMRCTPDSNFRREYAPLPWTSNTISR